MKGFLKDPQRITTIAVTFISVCALFVSIRQTQILSEHRELMLKQSKAAVWPRLELDYLKSHNRSDNSTLKLQFFLSNNGTGPAEITDARVRFRGEVVNHWWEFFAALNLPDTLRTFISNADFNKKVLKAGDELTFLNFEKNLPLAQIVYDNLKKLEIELIYQSVFEDKWLLHWTVDEVTTTAVKEDQSFPKTEQFR